LDFSPDMNVIFNDIKAFYTAFEEAFPTVIYGKIIYNITINDVESEIIVTNTLDEEDEIKISGTFFNDEIKVYKLSDVLNS